MTRQFTLTGLPTTSTPEELEGYDTKTTILLTDTRDGGNTVLVSADDDESAEFQFEDDTFWMGTVSELPIILQHDRTPTLTGFNDGVMEIPGTISFGSDERGGL